MSSLRISQRGSCVRFSVHVQPRASCTELAGVHGDALKIRLAAPPVDGAANDALMEFLARALAVPRRSIRLVSGATSRSKVVEVGGVDEDQVRGLAEASERG